MAERQRVGGIVVSIAAFQAVDPGSIPGRRNLFISTLLDFGAFPYRTMTKRNVFLVSVLLGNS